MSIADDMIDGTLCTGCGVLLDGEADGFPRYCGGCGGSVAHFDPGKNVQCLQCARKFRSVDAMEQHARAKHWWRTGEVNQ